MTRSMCMSSAAAVAVVLGAAVGASAAPTVEYCEIFPNTGSSARSMADVGWKAIQNGANFTAPTISSGAGRPADAVSVNSSTVATAPNGFLSRYLAATEASYLTYTEEHPIDLASKPLNSVSWYQGNTRFAEFYMHVALRIDNTWYVSADGFTNNSLTSGSEFATKAELKELTILPSTSWNYLNSNQTIGASAVLPTTGTLDGFGLLADTPTHSVRFDTFTVTVVPEPATGLVVGGLLMLAAGRRRRIA